MIYLESILYFKKLKNNCFAAFIYTKIGGIFMKTLKKFLSAFMIVVMVLTSIPLTGFVGLGFSNITASAASVDYSDLTPNQYLSKFILNKNYKGVASSDAGYKKLISTVYNRVYPEKAVPCAIDLRNGLKNDVGLISLEVIYNLLTFNPSTLVQKGLEISDIYAGVLINLIGATLSDATFLDHLNCSTNQLIMTTTEQLVEAAKTNEEVAEMMFYYGKNTKKLSQSQKYVFENFILTQNEDYPLLSKAPDYVGAVSTALKVATSIEDVIQMVAQIESIGEVTNSIINILNEMHDNTNNAAIKEAVNKVKDHVCSTMKTRIIRREGVEKIAKAGIAWGVDKLWDWALTSIAGGPIASAILIGQALGDGIASFCFSADAFKDKIAICFAVEDLESLLSSVVIEFAGDYKSNESATNADNFISSFDMLFMLYELDTDYMLEAYETVYTDGFITSMFHKKELANLKNGILGYKSEQVKWRQFLTIERYKKIYKLDAPARYDFYFKTLGENGFGAPVITPADIQNVCKEYNYIDELTYWTYPLRGTATSGYVGSIRKGREYSYRYNGVECYGFANFVMSKVTGTDVYPKNGNKNGWVKLSPNDVTELKVGDIVRIGKSDSNGHTGVVYTVFNDKCTFVQCLGGVDNIITIGKPLSGTQSLRNNYKRYSTLSEMKKDNALLYVYRYKGNVKTMVSSSTSGSSSAPANPHYNASSRFNPGTYIVTAKAGLNTRKLPSAVSAKITALKYNTSILVTATDGNWGYTNKGWICLDYARYVAGSVNEVYTTIKYDAGTYKVSARDGLKFRSGPNTSYTHLGSLKYNTEFNVSKVDGSWGYSDELKGWLCLDYAKYIAQPVVPELPTPNTPNLVSVTSSEIAVGDLISVDWGAIENATYYTASLIDKAINKVVETKDKITNTSINFATPYAGTFDVCVVACNEQKTSVPGYINGITAKAPLTVTFKDWNGMVISTQKVSYGRDATLPANPTRTGHTFASWDGSHTCIMEDTTITATYSRNLYKVSFYDYDGTLLKSEDVLYQDSATAPSYTAPTGYSFISWDKDYSNITNNLDVKAIIQWSSKYPLEISTTSSIYRNGKTYITTAIINNSPNAVSNAKVIVSLKTSEGKELAEVVSGNISIAAGAVKDLTLNATYDGAATVGNIFVVKADDQNIPLAKHLVVEVNQGTAWSTWSTTAPPSNALKTESRTEYRYRTKSYTTSTNSSLSGWTKYNTTSAYSGWSGWSAWQDASVSSNDLREVKTQTVQDTTKYTAWSDWSGWQDAAITSSNLVDVGTQQVVVSSNYKTQYNYSRYKNSAGTWCGPTKGTWGGYSCTVYQETGWRDSALTYVRTDQTNQAGAVKVYKKSGDSLHWYNEQTKQVWVSDNYKTQYRKRTRSYGTKTQYSYRTRSLNYTYYYYKWSDWSGWSTNKVTGNSDKEVQTRTTYRYISNIPANVEDKTGVSRTISGSVNANYAGSNALLHIYNVNGETQYYGQTLIGNNGSYSYTLKLKNEPTVQSGDYLVVLSIEGTNQAIMLDPIKAPVPEYTVTFKNHDGSILSTQTVKKGENAISPVSPTRTGYDFIGWDNTATNIQSDLIITAQFSKKVFDVVFIDEINSTTETVRFEYGENISAPDITEIPESYNFLGWDALNNGITVVEDNMIINAMYERKTFDVVFLDYAGNVLSEYSVEYGDGVAPPVPVEDGIHQFIEWETDVDFDNITESATILPIFDYVNTVASPVANITSGEYSSKQIVTLSCDTEDAQIYYTVDGTDPLEVVDSISTFSLRKTSQDVYNGVLYTGPFEIDSTAELVFVATKENMNVSPYENKVYAINSSSVEEEKCVVTVHNDASGNDFSYLVTKGSKLTLSEIAGDNNVLVKGVYRDSAFTSEWSLINDTVNTDVDLYINWDTESFNVSFTDIDGNVISSQNIVKHGSAIAPEAPIVEGYKFVDWSEDFSFISSDLVVNPVYCANEDAVSLKISSDNIKLDKNNKTTQLSAKLYMGTDELYDHIMWISSDENIATVNEEGLVSAITEGEVVIAAVSDEYYAIAECVVVVEFECKHNYVASVTNPSCTTDGYTTYTCSKCGDNYTGNTTNSVGHDMSVIIPIIAPSCENEGQDIIKCSRCEYSEISQTEATGHYDNDGNNICDDCGKELSTSSKCSCNCHKTGFMGLIWKILRFFYKLFKMNKVCGCGIAHY